MNNNFENSRPPSSQSAGASSDSESEDSQVLEGEVVGSAPAKKSPPHGYTPPPNFKVFSLAFSKLKRNCLLASVAFFTFTILAIIFGNGWLFLLALLLPPWIFSWK